MANDFNVSRKTLIRYLDELITDINNYFPEFNLIFEVNRGKIVTFDIEKETALYLLSYLNLSYTEETKEFQMIHLLLQKKIKNVNELAEELHQSLSTTYLTLDRVLYLLKHFDIQLNLSSQNHISNFVYEEKKLRLFGYYFYWLTYRGIKLPNNWKENSWIQPTFNKNQENFISQLLPSKQNQILYIGIIWYRRLLLRQKTLQFPEPFKSILLIMTNIHDVTKTYLSVPLGINSCSIEDETLFINLFIRHLISDIDSDSQKFFMMTELKKLDNPIIHLSNSLLDRLISNFNLLISDKNKAFFYYYFVLFFMYTQYFDIKIPISFFNRTTFKNNNNYELNNKISRFLKNFIKTEPLVKKVKIDDFYFQLLVSQIYVYLDMLSQSPLKIASQFSKNIMGEELIKHRLTKIYTSKALIFTSNYQEADLVISESYEGLKKEKYYFYIDSLTDEEAWVRLFNYVQEQILARNF